MEVDLNTGKYGNLDNKKEKDECESSKNGDWAYGF